ncbi:ACP S-malonyltransferase [Acidithiobacillus thiooxidans]|uniref:Malonyl CoA-acyl carrier protein transacylase n=1 Tax=Acidithiobacillus thiooxidans ATCC 19377 TaxID=637390 RepID=A0A5P9XP55_ACITH|nr:MULTISPECIES: ACP S-malonyltransferase [Acidithiobacillus]MBU2742393.1 ACP S-malonyltransferase [Acidithiobacillus albertensis]MBU2794304.1 ACP S-malonyltransferase [Acidithiobacillus thiooxidans]MBU2836827.1 ACP S-malonyltransferase [Acidithiobacillus thiooxidans]MBU2843344.1 ACP S-malonyltransferase [Acidithiobacillus thiooxidans]MDA8177143.1 ACP S-malonyltransferase [Acidithiobacillus sp.]
MHGSIAFVFPGQGSQSVQMLADLASTHPLVQEVFAEASDVLGEDLWALSQNGPVEKLNQTRWTQPLMLAAGYAVYRVWEEEGGAYPDFVAGHSLGEYTALVVADALDYADAVRLVAERGRLMQEAVPEGAGAMAAVIGLADDDLKRLCAQESQDNVLSAANFNAPGQVVVAGETAAVERLVEAARSAGAKRVVLLPVSVPSHCSLMTEAAQQFATVLESVTFRAPKAMLIHNADVLSHTTPDSIRAVLAKQLYSPVRWTETIRYLARQGALTFVEMGPGRVLSGLGKRIEPSLTMLHVEDGKSLKAALELV